MKTQQNAGTVGVNRDELAYGVSTIRHSLLIGLAAFGELERLRDAAELAKVSQQHIPESLRPIGVSGDSSEVSKFADAMRMLESIASGLEA